MVSPRLPPHLFRKSLDETEGTHCPFFYRNQYSQRLEYKRRSITIKQRPVLACVKRVCGGAFSGYPKSTRSRQARVIELLVEEANRYARIRDSKIVGGKWKSREEAAGRITSALKDYLGNEVNKHLDRISRIIVEKQTIRGWNMFTNSCQWLVMRLLSGKDFEYIIPRVPGSIGETWDETAEEASFTWPRYLVSFGPNIEGFNQSFYQPDSMITDFAQSRPSIDYDLIEYIELCLRRRRRVWGKFFGSIIMGPGLP